MVTILDHILLWLSFLGAGLALGLFIGLTILSAGAGKRV